MTESPTHADTAGHYAAINGLNLYYEIHGTGAPLVMLHGGLGTISTMFVDLAPQLATTRQIITVDLQGHGRTADIERPIRYELLADDVAALVKHLGYERVDILGYSLGGGVALQTVIRHPELVRKLVLISTPSKRAGWYPEDRAGMDTITAEAGKTWEGSPMHQAYVAIAPQPENWPTLVDKMGDLLRQDYDWSEAVAAIKAPTLIVVGDADGVRLAHAVELYALLGGKTDGATGEHSHAQLAVLPNTTHLGVMSRENLLTAMIPPFLDAPMPAGE